MFELSPEQRALVSSWREEQDTKVVGMQKSLTQTLPNYGTIGGGYVYIFCPTSLGVIIKVRNEVTGDVLDLTDYEGW